MKKYVDNIIILLSKKKNEQTIITKNTIAQNGKR